jgi:DHA2 family methylenomycin A resistance protein-like MFS transporter
MSESKSVNKKSARSSSMKSLTLAAMSLGYAVVQLDVTIVNTALNAIGSSLGGGVSELQWVVTAYTIAFAALILTAGALGDRVGAKKVAIAGFAIFTTASLLCALSPSAVLLIAARALQGIGAALLVPNSLALLNHTYTDQKERGRAVGIWAAGASLALTAGPLVGGGLIAAFGWRSIFLVNLPIGAAGLGLTWRCVNETPASPKRAIDVAGQCLAISALGCIAAVIIEAGVHGWGNRWVLSGLGVAAVLATLFILRERHTSQPMLPLQLFSNPLFSSMSAVGLLINVPFYGLIFVLSLYFQQINGFSPLTTGLTFLPLLGAVLPANLLAPKITLRLGASRSIVIGALMVAAGCAALLGVDRGMSYWVMVAPLVVMGGGLGLLVPPLTSTLLGSVDKNHSGVAAGVLNSARQTGSVLGVAVFGSLVVRRDSFIFGMRAALIVSVVLFLIAAVTTVAGGRSRGKS